MRVSKAEKAQSRQRIIASAARLLRERGVDGTSVGDVMHDAGLTHGGFYRHFADKDALVAAAVADAFGQFSAELVTHAEAGDATDAAAAFIARYLSAAHVDNPGLGCPAAAAGADVGRAAADVREAFGAGVEAIIAALAAGLKGPHRRDRALRQFALMVGAVTLARASDSATAEAVLAAARAAG
jgi:TetR/AcrR family transcriptional repressor of nem operon